MTLGEYGVSALVGKIFDGLYLVVNGLVGEAGTFAEIFVGLIALALVGAMIALVAAVLVMVPKTIGSALKSVGGIGR